MNRGSSLAAHIIALVALCPAFLLGQGSATIFGIVTDPSGGAVPGAAVTVQNEQTGLARRSTTQPDGSYNFPDLPIGTYDITAENTGFKRFVQNGITLQVDENRRVPIELQIGSTSENLRDCTNLCTNFLAKRCEAWPVR